MKNGHPQKGGAMAMPLPIRRNFPNVTKIVNSTKPLVLSVKEADVAKGQEGESTECAIAKAARRQFKSSGAIVGMTFTYLIKGNRAVKFKTSVAASREIVSFDRSGDFAPGKYRLSPMPNSQSVNSAAIKRGQAASPAAKARQKSKKWSTPTHMKTERVRNLKDGTTGKE